MAMNEQAQSNAVDAVQRVIARLVASNPAGHNLHLIGGFRYRLLDQSVRTSNDIDYAWVGDLDEKLKEISALFRKRLVPLLRRQFGFEAQLHEGDGAGGSPAVKTVTLAVWKPGVEYSRIEIPVEVTRVVCLDPTEVRTVDGTVFPTISDADLIESKILAVFNRPVLQHRDLVDVFLFSGKLPADAPDRLRRKKHSLGLDAKHVERVLRDLDEHAAYHAKAIQEIINTQLDPVAARNIDSAGGARMLLEKTVAIIRSLTVPAGAS